MSLAALARHEARLAWREALWWLRGGRAARVRLLAVAALAVAALHWVAGILVGPLLRMGEEPGVADLVLVSGIGAMAWMLMVSQGIEATTRVLYARGDMELILSSPASARSLFALRLVGVAAAGTAMAVLVVGAFVNMLALRAGPHWLAAYGMVLAMGASAAAVAIATTLGLYRLLGPRRTRFAAQVVAAVVGAAIVIGLQVAAVVGHQGLERLAMLRAEAVVAAAPGPGSLLWWPARAALGEGGPLAAMLAAAALMLAAAVAGVSRAFAGEAVEAAGAAPLRAARARPVRFAARGPRAALRAKELTLLARDPWLLSQSLMQILYLVPPAVLLWQSFGRGADPGPLVVPILVMAGGQLAGGLAWLALSGEDAPDLVATAPLAAGAVLRAKVEAVLAATGLIMAPLAAGLALVAPLAGAAALAGILAAATSATAIQLLFRSAARRSAFSRRQTASRLATFAEAFASIAWAAAAALAAAGSALALAPALFALAVLGTVRALAPRRE